MNDFESGSSKFTWKERLAVAVAAVGLIYVFGGDLWLKLQRTKDRVRDSVRDNLPLELEIDRARRMAVLLVPDIRQNHEVIVREQVEIEDLRADIKTCQAELRELREQLLSQRAQIPSELEHPANAAADMEVRRRLRQRFSIYLLNETALHAKFQVLKHREDSLEKAQAAQNELLRKKVQLEAEVKSLESRLTLLQNNRVQDHIHVDEEKLARCEEQIRYLRKRLSLAERLAKGDSKTDTPILESDSLDDAIELEIDRHFAQSLSASPH